MKYDTSQALISRTWYQQPDSELQHALCLFPDGCAHRTPEFRVEKSRENLRDSHQKKNLTIRTKKLRLVSIAIVLLTTIVFTLLCIHYSTHCHWTCHTAGLADAYAYVNN